MKSTLSMTPNSTEHKKNCACELCKNNKPFNMPQNIIEAVSHGNLVIFAGAGVSTEGKEVYRSTFFEEIKNELSEPASTCTTFSELASKFCAQSNGRIRLLQKFRSRLDYMTTFPELYFIASRFHRELATIPHIHDIITTNWDDFFERECAAIPIVYPADFVIFSLIPGRKVLKIHGSINNYSSIVATREDYEKCYRTLSTGIIGAQLKTLLASKVILFVGYAFNDNDFNRICRLLTRELKNLNPHAYIVTVDAKAKDKASSLGFSITPIITDATYFLKILKSQLIKEKLMLSDEHFMGIEQTLQRLRYEHGRLLSAVVDFRLHPEMQYSSWYQDGLKHAFETLLSRRNTGVFSDPHNVLKRIYSYEEKRKDLIKAKKYGDVAYVEGFINGLVYFMSNAYTRDPPPMYYLFGCEDIKSLKECLKLAKKASILHKSSYELAKRFAQMIPSSDVSFHHAPFLG